MKALEETTFYNLDPNFAPKLLNMEFLKHNFNIELFEKIENINTNYVTSELSNWSENPESNHFLAVFDTNWA